MSVNLNNSMEDDHIFVKCLTKYHRNESEVDGHSMTHKLKLRDAVTRAYNKTYKTKLKPGEIIPLLKKQNKLQSFEPYHWQKKFLDEFEETPLTNGKEKKEKLIPNEVEDDMDDLDLIDNMDIEEAENSGPVNGISVSRESTSHKPSISVECKPDVLDYKKMSVYELKRALLVSKLEILDAQEAMTRAKESIKLNKEEFFKRGIRGLK